MNEKKQDIEIHVLNINTIEVYTIQGKKIHTKKTYDTKGIFFFLK